MYLTLFLPPQNNKRLIKAKTFIKEYLFSPSVSIGDICVCNLKIKRLRLQFDAEPQSLKECL
jgi:hypothetical protein